MTFRLRRRRLPRNADFAVIGAGFTGLCAAAWLHDPEKSVIVLEAGSIESGASGRMVDFRIPAAVRIRIVRLRGARGSWVPRPQETLRKWISTPNSLRACSPSWKSASAGCVQPASARITERWGGPILFRDNWQPVFDWHPASRNGITMGGFAGHSVPPLA